MLMGMHQLAFKAFSMHHRRRSASAVLTWD